MNVEIDFEVLEQTGMSADDYLYLYVIYKESYTYLNNLKEDKEIEGMLLYPTTTSTVRNERMVSGKRIMINNINLNQEWREIEEEMIGLIE